MVKGRWDSYLLTNGFLNTTVQKAFQPKTSGCEEHHQKLWSVLQDANSNQRSLAVAWIDLENAYGSVPHGLIDFALKYYHAPNKLTTCIQKLYSMGIYPNPFLVFQPHQDEYWGLSRRSPFFIYLQLHNWYPSLTPYSTTATIWATASLYLPR